MTESQKPDKPEFNVSGGKEKMQGATKTTRIYGQRNYFHLIWWGLTDAKKSSINAI
jgi:hypothetical protein